MAALLLFKHAAPAVRPDTPSSQWELSAAGQRHHPWICDILLEHRTQRIYCSLEPKALQTARLAAGAAGVDVRPWPGLHENDRTGFGYLPTDEWKARFREFFANPTRICIGSESAVMAQRRFADAVNSILKENEGETTAIVAHGTVITLFTTLHNAVAAFELWESLSTPSCVLLDAASFALEGVRNYGH